MEEQKSNTLYNVSSILIGFFAFMYNYVGELLLLIPISLMLDYLLGITAHIYAGGKFDKEIGIWGFIRKACYSVVILGAFVVDYLIYWLSMKMGLDINIRGVFVVAVSIYLISTEWISIFKHLNTLKVPIPKFLTKAFVKVVKETGEIAETAKGVK